MMSNLVIKFPHKLTRDFANDEDCKASPNEFEQLEMN